MLVAWAWWEPETHTIFQLITCFRSLTRRCLSLPVAACREREGVRSALSSNTLLPTLPTTTCTTTHHRKKHSTTNITTPNAQHKPKATATARQPK